MVSSSWSTAPSTQAHVQFALNIRRRLEGVDRLFPRSLRAGSWTDQSRIWDAARSALVTWGSHELHYVWPTVYS